MAAEVVGLVASAVTLFNLCMKGFDFIDTIKQYEYEVHKLTVKLTIEKCRLYAWGESMGLTASPRSGARIPFESCKFASTVEQTLRLILQILDASQRTRENYGCQRMLEASAFDSSSELQRASVVLELNATLKPNKAAVRQDYLGSKYFEKTWWAIRDRSKFQRLITDAKELIDGLQEITKDVVSKSKQDEIVSEHMTKSNDIYSLQTIAAVCRESYPSISEVASTRVSRLSLYGIDHGEVEGWVHDLESGLDDVINSPNAGDIDAMTMAELRQNLRSTLRRNNVLSENILKSIPVQGNQHYRHMLQMLHTETADAEFFEELDAVNDWARVLSVYERLLYVTSLTQEIDKDECRLASALFQVAADNSSSTRTPTGFLETHLKHFAHREWLKLKAANTGDNSPGPSSRGSIPHANMI